MKKFWKIFIGLHIFLLITSLLSFFLMGIYPYILCITFAQSLFIYIVFIYLGKYKVNKFLNIIFATILVIFFTFLMNYGFLELSKAFKIVVNASTIILVFQSFVFILAMLNDQV